MVVGLPGTGIGGLFYLFMALWMPVHELWRLLHGRSSLERWKFIALNWLVVGGILSCLWVTMLVMKTVLILTGLDKPKGLLEGAGFAAGLAGETNALFAGAGWASALSLVVLVAVVHILRVTVGRRSNFRPASQHA